MHYYIDEGSKTYNQSEFGAMRKKTFTTAFIVLIAGLFAAGFITGCQADQENYSLPDDIASSKYLYPEAPAVFAFEPEIAVTVDNRVLKAGSGEVNESIDIHVLSGNVIKNIEIKEMNSDVTIEMTKADDADNHYVADLIINTDIETNLEEKVYEIVCSPVFGKDTSTNIQITVVKFSSEPYYNTVYVNEYLFDYIDRGTSSQDDYETRKDKCIDILTDLEANGIIERDSIFSETESGTISYTPAGDITHFIKYKDSNQKIIDWEEG